MKRSKTYAAVTVFMELAATGAWAQQTQPSSAIDEVVVTATKRATNVQQTPIAMDVVGAQSLQDGGVTNFQQIAAAMPEINIGTTNGVYTTVTIRGVASYDATELGDPDVSFSIDGEYITRPLALAASMFDIARVETLRGPQGTLYGRNSAAGAVNIITNRPTDRFEGYETVNVGNYTAITTQGAVNLPITKDFKMRIAYLTDNHDGYTDNGVHGRTDDSDVKAGRVEFLYNPDKFSALLTLEAVQTGGNGPSTASVVYPVGFQPKGTALGVNVPLTIASRTSFPSNIDQYLRTDQFDARGEVSYDFDWSKLTYVGGLRRTILNQFQDIDGTSFLASDYHGRAHYLTNGNELRLASPDSSPITWQGGFFESNERQETRTAIYNNATYNPVLAAAGLKQDTVETLFFNYDPTQSYSEAVFGEVTVPLFDGVSLVGGGRWTHDHKTRSGFQHTLNSALYASSLGTNITNITSSAAGFGSWYRTTWHGGLDWQVTKDNLLYVSGSSGYKSGGFTTVNVYGPEDLKSVEVGSKNHFFDDRLQLNVDGFHYDYANQQVSLLTTLPNGNNAVATVNAASSEEQGIELEAVGKITPVDKVRLTADYLSAFFNTFPGSATAFGGATINLKLDGNRLPFAPAWTIGVGYEHTWTGEWGELRAAVNSLYKSSYYVTVYDRQAERQSGYTDTSLNLTYSLPGSAWQFSAYAHNLENERPLSFGGFVFAANTNLERYQFSAPRTFGVSGTFNF